MTHQISPHLAFFTPRQNKKAEQGTNPSPISYNSLEIKLKHRISQVGPNDKSA